MVVPDKTLLLCWLMRRILRILMALEAKNKLTHVYLVTDSEEAYQEMATQINAPQVIQLYREYTENFAINKGKDSMKVGLFDFQKDARDDLHDRLKE